MGKAVDLTGKRFGILEVKKRAKINQRKNAVWICKCDCGVYLPVVAYALKDGNPNKSCGCLQKEILEKANTKHGKSKQNKVHPLYHTFTSMKDRCYNPHNPEYKNYGGRGIKICDEWKNDFQSFYDWSIENSYKKGLSIDRENNDGNYSPNNCRWVTQKIQTRNTRTNILVTYLGETLCASEWAERFNINASVFINRIKLYGWSVEEALNTPVRKKRGNKYV